LNIYTSESAVKEEAVLNMAWDYFQQHANQRIRYFNFFVILSSLMTTGLLTTFRESFHVPLIGMIIGILQMVFAFVFWKIDERNKFLTKNGENTIKEIERNYFFGNNHDYSQKLRFFTNEEIETDKRARETRNIITKQMLHSRAFNLMFGVFFIIGFLGASASLYLKIFPTNTIKSSNDLIQTTNLDDFQNTRNDLIGIRQNIVLLNIEMQNLKQELSKIHNNIGIINENANSSVNHCPLPLTENNGKDSSE